MRSKVNSNKMLWAILLLLTSSTRMAMGELSAHREDSIYDAQGREIIAPNEKFRQEQRNGHLFDYDTMSHVIDHKRFVEWASSRCFVSTILTRPESVEPGFVFIKEGLDEIRLNASVDLETIARESGFHANKSTLVIVHGFKQGYPRSRWMRNLRDVFRENKTGERFNLIFMDWSRDSYRPYHRVAALSSVLSSYLANFLMKLTQLGADPMSIHLIGHSMGCHLAGFAGRKTRPRIGRITAFDPAGPCFGAPGDQLGPEDAHQVVVYHYDDAFLGFPASLGHYDVFVNGGWSQPNAKGYKWAMATAVVQNLLLLRRPVSDAHMRPIHMHTMQLAQANCQQVAYECRDYGSFSRGECGHCDHANSQCLFMGLPFQYRGSEGDRPTVATGPQPGKQMYLATSGQGSFCLQHYQILVTFDQSLDPQRVSLLMSLISWRHETIDIKVTNQMEPGVYSYLLLTETPPSKFHSASVHIVSKSDKSTMETVAAKNIEINFMSHKDPDVRKRFSSILCPKRTSTKEINPSDGSRDEAQIYQQC